MKFSALKSSSKILVIAGRKYGNALLTVGLQLGAEVGIGRRDSLRPGVLVLDLESEVGDGAAGLHRVTFHLQIAVFVDLVYGYIDHLPNEIGGQPVFVRTYMGV